MNKILVICGPTATGKTSLGISLAKKFAGEIINADSRQIYQGMDIGTGKDLDKFSIFNFSRQLRDPAVAGQFSIDNRRIGYYLLNNIKVWLYDVVKPNFRFSVVDYINCAVPVIDDIWRRGKMPILVGGTGFYIKALIDGIDTMGIEPDWGLREKLKNSKTQKLQELLKKVDLGRFNRMNQSDRNNPRRLIRAIEIAKNIKSQKSNLKNDGMNLNLEIKNILMVGLRASYEKLYERIDERVEKRLRQGLLVEIKKLLKKGYGFNNSVLGTTLAYKEWRKYFKNNKLKNEIVQKWKYDEHHYARRQMTWFRKALLRQPADQGKTHWFDIAQRGFSQKVEKLVRKWYDKRS